MVEYGYDPGNPALEPREEPVITLTVKQYLQEVETQCALLDEIRRLTRELGGGEA